MILQFTDDLKDEIVFANGAELAGIMGKDRDAKGRRVYDYDDKKKLWVHTFTEPVLVTDSCRISQLPPGKREALFALFASQKRWVEYRGTCVHTNSTHEKVWSPSIDTLLFAKALCKAAGIQGTAAEVGCGSAFLGKHALQLNPGITNLLVNDISPYAVQCAKDNISEKAEFYCGDGLEAIKGRKFSLLLCNPPYVPRPKSIDDNPYEGIGLLDHLIHHGQDYLEVSGVLVINISSLSENLVFSTPPSMKVQELEQMTVPLKVNNILNNKDWLKYLQAHGLERQNRKDYEYWHTIRILAMTK